MSQYLPEVAWSTLASNVRLGLTSYRYLLDVNYLDPNEPGATTMTMAINDWFIDFAGYPFIIEDIDGSTITVYDILERGDGTTSAYGPYANQLGYVYRPLNNAFLLSQAQLRKLDRSAADVIQNIEKSILLSGNILASSVTYTPTAPIVGNNVQDALDSVASQLGTISTTGFIKFTYTV